jgi:hypothetical protein
MTEAAGADAAVQRVGRLPHLTILSNRELHIVNPSGRAKAAYPISTFTYVIVKSSDPLHNGGDLKSFISYAISGGQAFGTRLDFVPLPAAVKRADQAALGLIH